MSEALRVGNSYLSASWTGGIGKSFYVYIPTLVSRSVMKTGLVDPVCRYNERVDAAYALTLNEKPRNLKMALVSGGVVLLGAVIAIAIASSLSDKTSKMILEDFKDRSIQGTILNITKEKAIILSSMSKSFDDFNELKSSEYYRNRVSKSVGSMMESIVINPIIICFEEEYSEINNIPKLKNFDFSVIDTITDTVSDYIHVGKEVYETHSSLATIKKSANEVEPIDYDNLSRLSDRV